MKKYVIGDMHGANKALLQCLERCHFDYENDQLITLGDIVDGWSESAECVETLLKIKNRIDIRGNHDEWAYKFLMFVDTNNLWTEQGGKSTIESFINSGRYMDFDFVNFFKNQHYYYIDDENRLFVHGGFNWHDDIKVQNRSDLMWDRHAFYTACMWEMMNKRKPNSQPTEFKQFSEIFVGHTSTTNNLENTIGNSIEPVKVANMWNLDQGAGWDGKLTIMDVETKEYWQSDIVSELYLNELGRRE